MRYLLKAVWVQLGLVYYLYGHLCGEENKDTMSTIARDNRPVPAPTARHRTRCDVISHDCLSAVSATV